MRGTALIVLVVALLGVASAQFRIKADSFTVSIALSEIKVNVPFTVTVTATKNGVLEPSVSGQNYGYTPLCPDGWECPSTLNNFVDGISTFEASASAPGRALEVGLKDAASNTVDLHGDTIDVYDVLMIELEYVSGFVSGCPSSVLLSSITTIMELDGDYRDVSLGDHCSTIIENNIDSTNLTIVTYDETQWSTLLADALGDAGVTEVDGKETSNVCASCYYEGFPSGDVVCTVSSSAPIFTCVDPCTVHECELIETCIVDSDGAPECTNKCNKDNGECSPQSVCATPDASTGEVTCSNPCDVVDACKDFEVCVPISNEDGQGEADCRDPCHEPDACDEPYICEVNDGIKECADPCLSEHGRGHCDDNEVCSIVSFDISCKDPCDSGDFCNADPLIICTSTREGTLQTCTSPCEEEDACEPGEGCTVSQGEKFCASLCLKNNGGCDPKFICGEFDESLQKNECIDPCEDNGSCGSSLKCEYVSTGSRFICTDPCENFCPGNCDICTVDGDLMPTCSSPCEGVVCSSLLRCDYDKQTCDTSCKSACEVDFGNCQEGAQTCEEDPATGDPICTTVTDPCLTNSDCGSALLCQWGGIGTDRVCIDVCETGLPCPGNSECVATVSVTPNGPVAITDCVDPCTLKSRAGCSDSERCFYDKKESLATCVDACSIENGDCGFKNCTYSYKGSNGNLYPSGRTCTDPCDTIGENGGKGICLPSEICTLTAFNTMTCVGGSDVCAPACANGGSCENGVCNCSPDPNLVYSFGGKSCRILIGCMDSEAVNFRPAARIADDSCLYVGCIKDAAPYNTAGNFRADSKWNVHSDDQCVYTVGCMKKTVSGIMPNGLEYTITNTKNYDPSATIPCSNCCTFVGCTTKASLTYKSFATAQDVDDCEFVIAGCMDSEADANSRRAGAVIHDQSQCRYTGCMERFGTLSGISVEFANYDKKYNVPGKCFPYIDKCLDPTADNYLPEDELITNVRNNIEKCIFYGCTDKAAKNYDDKATNSRGCTYDIAGCTLEGRLYGENLKNPTNYRPDATYCGLIKCSWEGCNTEGAPGNIKGKRGACTRDDGLGIIFRGASEQFDPNCIVESVACGDSEAANYDPNFTVHDPTMCVYPGCMDVNAKNYCSQCNVASPNECEYTRAICIVFGRIGVLKSEFCHIQADATGNTARIGKTGVADNKQGITDVYVSFKATKRCSVRYLVNGRTVSASGQLNHYNALENDVFSKADVLKFIGIKADGSFDTYTDLPQENSRAQLAHFALKFFWERSLGLSVPEYVGPFRSFSSFGGIWAEISNIAYPVFIDTLRDFIIKEDITLQDMFTVEDPDYIALFSKLFSDALVEVKLNSETFFVQRTGYSRIPRTIYAFYSNGIGDQRRRRRSAQSLDAVDSVTKDLIESEQQAIDGTISTEEFEAEEEGTDAAIESFVSTLVLGCTDPKATNYNSAATENDGSCVIAGCTTPSALNFDPAATTALEGSCIFPISGCIDPAANNYNSEATIQAGVCTYTILGCTNPVAINFKGNANKDDGSCIEAIVGCADPSADNFNAFATVADDSCVYVIKGCTDNSANNYDASATKDDGSCVFTITGCTDESAQNYDDTATSDDASCTYAAVNGCTDAEAKNFNPIATVDDGSCVGFTTACKDPAATNTDLSADASDPALCTYSIPGCTNPAAENFDNSATVSDGSCVLRTPGCTSPGATNYNVEATVDDGSCDFTVSGCTNNKASNYNPAATVDDGSCVSIKEGCTDPAALNYDEEANVSDGSCVASVLGCTDGTASNYNPLATVDDGTCVTHIPGCLNADALNYNPLATIEDGSCEFAVVKGCMNIYAENYNPGATEQPEGACIFADNCAGEDECGGEGETCHDIKGTFFCGTSIPVVQTAEQPGNVLNLEMALNYFTFAIESEFETNVNNMKISIVTMVNSLGGETYSYNSSNIDIVEIYRSSTVSPIDLGVKFYIRNSSSDASNNNETTAAVLSLFEVTQLNIIGSFMSPPLTVNVADGVENPLPKVPTKSAGAVHFIDTDGDESSIGGVVTVAALPSDVGDVAITFYYLQWGSSPTEPLIGVPKLTVPNIAAPSGGDTTITIRKGTLIPNGATYILAYSSNPSGASLVPSALALVDYVCDGQFWLPSNPTVVADASSGTNPELAFDGDDDTKWCAEGDNDEYIDIDMGSEYVLSRIAYLAPVDGLTEAKFQVASTLEGPFVTIRSFSPVDSVSWGPDFPGSLNVVQFEDVTGRYFRFMVVDAADIVCVNRIRLYGSPAATSLLTPTTAWTYTASSTATDSDAKYAFDSDVDTTWTSTSKLNEYLRIDFGGEYTITKITLRFPANSVRTGYISSGRSTSSDFVSVANFKLTRFETTATFDMAVSTSRFEIYIQSSTRNLEGPDIAITDVTFYGSMNRAQKVSQQGWFATASSSGGIGMEANLAVDGDPTSSWQAATSGAPGPAEWIQVKFGTFLSISEVRVLMPKFAGNAINRIKTGRIERLVGTLWEKVDSFHFDSNVPKVLDPEGRGRLRETGVIVFAEPIFTSGIRLVVRSSYSGVTIGAAEISVYGWRTGSLWIPKSEIEIEDFSSQINGRNAINVNDDNPATWWQAASGADQWIDFDFGAVYELEAIHVQFKRLRVDRVSLQKPGTGKDWYTVAWVQIDEELPPYDTDVIDELIQLQRQKDSTVEITFDAVASRFWRVHVHESHQNKIGVKEVSFFGKGPVQFTAVPIASSFTSVSSARDGHGAELAFDGNQLTYWEAVNNTGWLLFSFADAISLDMISVTPINGGIKDAVLQYWDIVAEGWLYARSISVAEGATDAYEVDFPTVSATLWRFEISSTHNNSNATVAELVFYSAAERNCVYLRRRR